MTTGYLTGIISRYTLSLMGDDDFVIDCTDNQEVLNQRFLHQNLL